MPIDPGRNGSCFFMRQSNLCDEEMLRVSAETCRDSVSLFEQTGTFVESLLKAVENRSNGRVEQALVGAKLQLRFPKTRAQQSGLRG